MPCGKLLEYLVKKVRKTEMHRLVAMHLRIG